MDVRAPVGEAVVRAKKAFKAGNYRRDVELLLPFVRPKQKEKLSPSRSSTLSRG